MLYGGDEAEPCLCHAFFNAQNAAFTVKMMEKPCQLISIFRYPLGCSFLRCAVNEHMVVFHFLDKVQFTFFRQFRKVCLFPVAPLYARFFCLGKKAVDTGIGILDIVNRVVAGLLFRQVKKDVPNRNDVIYVHVTLVPYIAAAGELKTKPTQHSVKELRSIGIQPDIIVCRTVEKLSDEMKKKIGMFCDVEPEAVINNLTADSIYEVPLLMEQEGLDHIALKKLGLEDRPVDMEDWKAMVERMTTAKKEVQIALVGKYVRLHDAYLSVAEALSHAGYAMGAKVNIRWINSEILEEEKPDLDEVFAGVDGIVVPGGFGYRGVEGKIDAIRYARENKIPFLGLCLGMQCAVIEFARNVCHMEQANSSEFIPDGKYPVIDLMPDQEDVTEKGGTMRLGIYPCKLKEGTRARTLYENQEIVYERHRHRYEVSNEFRPQMEAAGLVISGTSPDDRLVEIIELKDHPYFAATQAHPEFKSRPNRPHPLFNGFMEAAVKQSGE